MAVESRIAADDISKRALVREWLNGLKKFKKTQYSVGAKESSFYWHSYINSTSAACLSKSSEDATVFAYNHSCFLWAMKENGFISPAVHGNDGRPTATQYQC
jgi:hypothetical protein